MPTFNQSGIATPNSVDPAAVQALWPDWLLNPIGSEYGALYSHPSTINLRMDLSKDIIQNFPAQYNSLRLFYSKTPEFHSAEFKWVVQDWPRPILEVAVGAAGAVYPATQSITLTAGGASYIVANDQVFFPDDTSAKVHSVNTGTNVITLQAPINGTTSTLATGDKLNPGGQVKPDGSNWIGHFDRMVTRTFTNYITEFMRGDRWTTRTAEQIKSQGTNNYFEKQVAMKRMLCEQDAYQQFWNGTKGAYAITSPAGTGLTGGTYEAKTSWGIYPFMVANGAKHATCTPATIVSDLTNLCMTTNFKSVNDPRFVFGTEKAIHSLNMVMKDPVKYTPADKTYDMGLDMYHISPTIKIVPVICPLHESRFNLFPASWENRLFVLDTNTITPVCENGQAPFMQGNTGSLYLHNGGYQDFIDYWIKANVSMKMDTVDGSFYIDIVGI